MDKAKFETISKAEKLILGRNHYFVSKQKIIQSSGDSSVHLVVKKQPYNDDESPQGQSKQLFIPFSDSDAVLKHISSFLEGEE